MSQQLVGPAMPLGPDRSEYFEALVTADASGEASEDERALLAAEPKRWQAALEHLLDDTEDELAKLRRLPGPERLQVVADFEAERDRLAVALARLTGAPLSPELELTAEPPRLQATWAAGQLVVWVGGPTGEPVGVDELRAWLAEAEAPAGGWEAHPGVPVPGADKAAGPGRPPAQRAGLAGPRLGRGGRRRPGGQRALDGRAGQLGRRAGGPGPHGAPAQLPRRRHRQGCGQRAGRGGGGLGAGPDRRQAPGRSWSSSCPAW